MSIPTTSQINVSFRDGDRLLGVICPVLEVKLAIFKAGTHAQVHIATDADPDRALRLVEGLARAKQRYDLIVLTPPRDGRRITIERVSSASLLEHWRPETDGRLVLLFQGRTKEDF